MRTQQRQLSYISAIDCVDTVTEQLLNVKQIFEVSRKNGSRTRGKGRLHRPGAAFCQARPTGQEGQSMAGFSILYFLQVRDECGRPALQLAGVAQSCGR